MPMQVQCARETAAVWRIGLRPDLDGGIRIDAGGVAQVQAALDAVEHSACRALVVAGDGGVFCEGMDVGALTGASEGDVRDFATCVRRLREMAPVVVAVVEGRAVGGGVGLAAAADVVVASPRATFSLPELALGLTPAIVLPLLLARMPAQKVRLLALTGGINVQQALACGLVDQVAEDVEREVRGVIKHILRLSPEAVGDFKRLCRQMQGMALAEALDLGAKTTAQAIGNAQTQDDIRRFLDGEAPPWFARYQADGGDG